jgi:hypothetical protein
MEFNQMKGRSSKIGETRISPNGYHYTRISNKWELTGRLVAGKRLGRPLTERERVRYIDKDKLNNDPDNLIVYETTKTGTARKLAQLRARRDELNGRIELLEEELDRESESAQ